MLYPADWNEFEDGEGSFLFYNPSEWTGNFRISAYKGNAMYDTHRTDTGPADGRPESGTERQSFGSLR